MEDLPQKTQPAIVEPLPRQQRHRIFLSLLLIFVCAVPIFVFYATGYRYNIFDNQNGIITTGGIYIAVAQNNGEIFLNNESARGSRIFRRATYVQSVLPGVHRVHVQGEGLQTWVKDLPVFSHMVTEAEAILLPLVPQARLVTANSTQRNFPVVTESEAMLLQEVGELVSLATSIVAKDSVFPTDIISNPEFLLLQNLFNPEDDDSTATSTATSPALPRFRFADGSLATSSATSTEQVVARGNMSLVSRDGALFAQYVGSARSVPHYFCVPAATVASTSELFGVHVAYGIDRVRVIQTSIQPTISATLPGETRICRNEIRLDTKFQEIISFDFLPGSSDHVIVHRADGVYVVEIDDRAWQNVQSILPRPVDKLIVDNNRIFVQIDTIFLEISTVLPNN